MERNPEKWEYLGDRSESRDKQYMAAGGISHRYFFNSDASLKTTVAATYSQLDGGADGAASAASRICVLSASEIGSSVKTRTDFRS